MYKNMLRILCSAVVMSAGCAAEDKSKPLRAEHIDGQSSGDQEAQTIGIELSSEDGRSIDGRYSFDLPKLEVIDEQLDNFVTATPTGFSLSAAAESGEILSANCNGSSRDHKLAALGMNIKLKRNGKEIALVKDSLPSTCGAVTVDMKILEKDIRYCLDVAITGKIEATDMNFLTIYGMPKASCFLAAAGTKVVTKLKTLVDTKKACSHPLTNNLNMTAGHGEVATQQCTLISSEYISGTYEATCNNAIWEPTNPIAEMCHSQLPAATPAAEPALETSSDPPMGNFGSATCGPKYLTGSQSATELNENDKQDLLDSIVTNGLQFSCTVSCIPENPDSPQLTLGTVTINNASSPTSTTIDDGRVYTVDVTAVVNYQCK